MMFSRGMGKASLPRLLAMGRFSLIVQGPARADNSLNGFGYNSRGTVTANGTSLGAFTIINLYVSFENHQYSLPANSEMTGP